MRRGLVFYANYNSGWRVLLVGGGWDYGGYAGLFYFDAHYTSSYSYSSVGARLLFHPLMGDRGPQPPELSRLHQPAA